MEPALRWLEELPDSGQTLLALSILAVPFLALGLFGGVLFLLLRHDPLLRTVRTAQWMLVVVTASFLIAAILAGWCYAGSLFYLSAVSRIERLPVKKVTAVIIGPALVAYIFFRVLPFHLRESAAGAFTVEPVLDNSQRGSPHHPGRT